MSKKIKDKIIKELSQRYQPINHCFLVNYRGMNAATLNNFRSYLKEGKVKLNVIKNSLLSQAFKDINTLIDGPIAVVYSTETDGISTAKRLNTWTSKNKLPKIKGGYFEGTVVGSQDVKKIAKMPSRKVLLAQLAGGFKGPTTRLASGLSEIITRFVRTLNQYSGT